MKKQLKNLLVLAGASFLLGGCNQAQDSSASESSSVSESSSEEAGEKWSKEQQGLLKQYCGEVLPYPEAYFKGAITCEERSLSDGVKYLAIQDKASNFTLKNYYKTLVEDGWTLVKGYGDSDLRDASGLSFVELTKEVGEVGYDITYYYEEAKDDDSSFGNLLTCYNHLTTKMSASTSWSEEALSAMKESVDVALPFVALGENFSFSSPSEDSFLLTDSSTKDKRKEYADSLVKDGFELMESVSSKNDLYYLSKKTDGGTVAASLDYSGGNYFQFFFNLETKTSESWPSEALKDIESRFNLTIPSFPAKGSYYYTSKNGKVTIYARVTSSFDAVEYAAELKKIGLIDYSGYGQTSNWEETLSLAYGYPSSSSKYFTIIVQESAPSSAFSSSWPEKAINDFYEKMKIDVDLPSPIFDSLEKEIKYTADDDYDALLEKAKEYVIEYADYYDIDATDAEEVLEFAIKVVKQTLGLDIMVYDADKEAFNQIDSCFYNASYHKEVSDEDGSILYEDPTGKAAVTLSYSETNGITSVHVGLGSDEAHSPVFAFEKDARTLGIGTSTQLGLDVDMLPYAVSYSTDDSTGKVSVSSDGVLTIEKDADLIGKKVKVTATIVTPSSTLTATCEVTIAERSEYDHKSAMEAVVKLMNEHYGLKEGDSQYLYTCPTHASSYEGYYYVLYNIWGESSSETGAEARKTIEDYFIPQGFELKSDWEATTSSHDMPEYICYYVADNVTLEYTVHLNPSATMIEIFSYPTNRAEA